MGSSLKLESEVGRGSKFFFQLGFHTEGKKLQHEFSATSREFNVAIYKSQDMKIYEELLLDYLNAFGLHSRMFSNINELESISFQKQQYFYQLLLISKFLKNLKKIKLQKF